MSEDQRTRPEGARGDRSWEHDGQEHAEQIREDRRDDEEDDDSTSTSSSTSSSSSSSSSSRNQEFDPDQVGVDTLDEDQLERAAEMGFEDDLERASRDGRGIGASREVEIREALREDSIEQLQEPDSSNSSRSSRNIQQQQEEQEQIDLEDPEQLGEIISEENLGRNARADLRAAQRRGENIHDLPPSTQRVVEDALRETVQTEEARQQIDEFAEASREIDRERHEARRERREAIDQIREAENLEITRAEEGEGALGGGLDIRTIQEDRRQDTDNILLQAQEEIRDRQQRIREFEQMQRETSTDTTGGVLDTAMTAPGEEINFIQDPGFDSQPGGTIDPREDLREEPGIDLIEDPGVSGLRAEQFVQETLPFEGERTQGFSRSIGELTQGVADTAAGVGHITDPDTVRAVIDEPGIISEGIQTVRQADIADEPLEAVIQADTDRQEIAERRARGFDLALALDGIIPVAGAAPATAGRAARSTTSVETPDTTDTPTDIRTPEGTIAGTPSRTRDRTRDPVDEFRDEVDQIRGDDLPGGFTEEPGMQFGQDTMTREDATLLMPGEGQPVRPGRRQLDPEDPPTEGSGVRRDELEAITEGRQAEIQAIDLAEDGTVREATIRLPDGRTDRLVLEEFQSTNQITEALDSIEAALEPGDAIGMGPGALVPRQRTQREIDDEIVDFDESFDRVQMDDPLEPDIADVGAEIGQPTRTPAAQTIRTGDRPIQRPFDIPAAAQAAGLGAALTQDQQPGLGERQFQPQVFDQFQQTPQTTDTELVPGFEVSTPGPTGSTPGIFGDDAQPRQPRTTGGRPPPRRPPGGRPRPEDTAVSDPLGTQEFVDEPGSGIDPEFAPDLTAAVGLRDPINPEDTEGLPGEDFAATGLEARPLIEDNDDELI